MPRNSSIEWTDDTWNPWVGCTKVSEGCARCYMYRLMIRKGEVPAIVERASDEVFNSPLKWTGRKVFTCSMSDFFHVDADEWRDEAWNIIRRTPQNDYLVLTKRAERIKECLPHDWGQYGWDNVWLGVSIEKQKYVTERLTHLLSVPSGRHFVSLEPLLEKVTLWNWLPLLNWVIVGGESGPNCRPIEAEWVRKIRKACRRDRVPFFFKQWGGWPTRRGGDEALLDGRLWHEVPEPKRARQLDMMDMWGQL